MRRSFGENDPRFVTRTDRLKNKDALYEILEKVFLEKPGEEWLQRLEGRLPAGPPGTPP